MNKADQHKKKQKADRYKKKQIELQRKKQTYYVTDDEHEQLKRKLRAIRDGDKIQEDEPAEVEIRADRTGDV